MNTVGYNWTLIDLDNYSISSAEKHWSELCSVSVYNGESLYLSMQPAAQLSTTIQGRTYCLRAPDRESRFFIANRSRAQLFGDGREYMYFVIGCIGVYGKLTKEIDTYGNETTRIDPAPRYVNGSRESD